MPWLPQECGGFSEQPKWRLYCLHCAQRFEVELVQTLRRGDTHTEEECDGCGRILAETVDASKEQVTR